MANIDVKQIRIAKRYSEALIDSAIETNELQKFYDELRFVQETLSGSIDLKVFLENPIINRLDKKDVVNQVFATNLSSVVLNFLLLLVENNRFNIIDSVVIEYLNRLDQINNVVKAKVVSAVELDSTMKTRLIEKLENKISKKVLANYEIKPEIIAGLVIEINDKTIDTSLKTKLNSIKKQLI